MTLIRLALVLTLISFASSGVSKSCIAQPCPTCPSVLATPPSPQTPTVAIDDARNKFVNSTCVSWQCEIGSVTAGHCLNNKGGIYGLVHLPSIDVCVLTGSIDAQKKTYSVSIKPPVTFVDRRGIKHDVKSLWSDQSYRYIDLGFHSGESGSPVFDADGDVCGVVIGNRLRDGRWYGMIARLDRLALLVSERPDPSSPQRRRVFRPDADRRYKSEPLFLRRSN